MHIIGSHGELKRYMEHTVRTALGNEIERIVTIDVELSTPIGRPTYSDNLCGIRAVLRRAGVVFVHGRSADPKRAIDSAGERLRTALAAWPPSRTHG